MEKMINFQRLKYFCAMVEEGGIHKAARRLGLSQPPLSLALKELESDLGCQLVFREGRNWVVTEAGQRLYEEGRAILAQTASLASSMRDAASNPGSFARAGFSTSCVSLFQQMLKRMTSRFPGMGCQVKFGDSHSLAENVRQREIDFAVLYLPVPERDFEIFPLKEQILVALFSDLLEIPEDRTISLARLCEYPLLLPKRWSGGGIYDIFARETQSRDLSPRIVCQTQSSYLLASMLGDVPAAAILPRNEVAESRNERLVEEFLHIPLKPALITLKNIYLPLAARRLIALLRDSYGS